MGNANSGLPYNEGGAIDYNHHWQLNEGTKKTPDLEKVCIMKFDKTRKDRLDLAMRCFQKMRTLKHPNILSYIDGVDLEEKALVIVTEPCIPLMKWMSDRLAERDKSNQSHSDFANAHIQEITWGIKCVLNALQFLHTQASLGHGYLGLHAIFVCPNGDWKLGSFDLACNITVYDDEVFFKRYNAYLTSAFMSPERSNIDRGDIVFRKAFGVIDIYSLACCIEEIFSYLGISVPAHFEKYLKKMKTADFLKRPSARQLIKSQLFSTEYIKLMESLGESSSKTLVETLEDLKMVASHINEIPPFLCVFKVLPTIRTALSVCIQDFQIRDSREFCRQCIGLSLGLLSTMVENDKISPEEYENKVLPMLVQLWSMSDRTVRTCLLRTTHVLIGFTPNKIVNEHIFDPMLAGFADSNATMREDTLKNLVHVVDKLEGKHMLDKLVRCIVSLQNDSEPSLRTNATIFLGKVATKMEPSVRLRVIYPSFIRAMRDSFMHCRIAAIKSSLACLPLMQVPDLVESILTQVCVLTKDPSRQVRELAISFMEESMKSIRELHTTMCQQEDEARREAMKNPPQRPEQSEQTKESKPADNSLSNSWVASLVPSIATMEKAAASVTKQYTEEPSVLLPSGGMASKMAHSAANQPKIATPEAENRDSDLEENTWESGDEYDSAPFKKGMMNIQKKSTGWDDLDDFELDNVKKPVKMSSLGAKKDKKEKTEKLEKAEKKKVPVKKVNSGNAWDFDDFDVDSPKNSAPVPASATMSGLKEKKEKKEKKSHSSGWGDDDWDDQDVSMAPAPAPGHVRPPTASDDFFSTTATPKQASPSKAKAAGKGMSLAKPGMGEKKGMQIKGKLVAKKVDAGDWEDF